jgi:prefoldin subunit 5
MGLADNITQKRRDVRHLADELTALENELGRLQPGPGYYEAKQKLEARIGQFKAKHQQAQSDLTQLQTGFQGHLL